MRGITVSGRKGRRQGSDISIRIAALVGATCIFAACSSSPATHDTAVDTNLTTDGGVCLIPLDAAQPFGGCPPTFDDTSWRTQVCPTFSVNPAFVDVSEQVCAGYRSRNFDLGTHRWICYYAPSSGALVAGYFVDDTPDLCDDTTAFVQAGDVPAKGTCNARVPVDNPCDIHADGGADADSGAGQ